MSAEELLRIEAGAAVGDEDGAVHARSRFARRLSVDLWEENVLNYIIFIATREVFLVCIDGVIYSVLYDVLVCLW